MIQKAKGSNHPGEKVQPRISSELVVVDFDPVAVGILQINLMDAVRAVGHLTVACEIAVFHLHAVETSREIGDRRHAEGKVNVNLLRHNLRGTANYMELLVSADAEPDMLIVFERVGDALEAEDLFVEVGALLQITHMDGGVIEFRGLAGSAGLRKEQSGGEKTRERQNQAESNVVFHGKFPFDG